MNEKLVDLLNRREDLDVLEIKNKKEYVNNILHTAKVLIEKGKVGSFNGCCLEADVENRVIFVHRLNLNY